MASENYLPSGYAAAAAASYCKPMAMNDAEWENENLQCEMPIGSSSSSSSYKLPTRFSMIEENGGENCSNDTDYDNCASQRQSMASQFSNDGILLSTGPAFIRAKSSENHGRRRSAIRCSRQTQRLRILNSAASQAPFQRGQFQLRDSRRKTAEMLKSRHGRQDECREMVKRCETEDSLDQPKRKVRFAGEGKLQPGAAQKTAQIYGSNFAAEHDPTFSGPYRGKTAYATFQPTTKLLSAKIRIKQPPTLAGNGTLPRELIGTKHSGAGEEFKNPNFFGIQKRVKKCVTGSTDDEANSSFLNARNMTAPRGDCRPTNEAHYCLLPQAIPQQQQQQRSLRCGLMPALQAEKFGKNFIFEQREQEVLKEKVMVDVPGPSTRYTLEEILGTPGLLKKFEFYLAQRQCFELLQFYGYVAAYKDLPQKDRAQRAKKIYEEFFLVADGDVDDACRLNVSADVRKDISSALESHPGAPHIFDCAVQEVVRMLKHGWVFQFNEALAKGEDLDWEASPSEEAATDFAHQFFELVTEQNERRIPLSDPTLSTGKLAQILGREMEERQQAGPFAACKSPRTPRSQPVESTYEFVDEYGATMDPSHQAIDGLHGRRLRLVETTRIVVQVFAPLAAPRTFAIRVRKTHTVGRALRPLVEWLGLKDPKPFQDGQPLNTRVPAGSMSGTQIVICVGDPDKSLKKLVCGDSCNRQRTQASLEAWLPYKQHQDVGIAEIFPASPQVSRKPLFGLLGRH